MTDTTTQVLGTILESAADDPPPEAALVEILAGARAALEDGAALTALGIDDRSAVESAHSAVRTALKTIRAAGANGSKAAALAALALRLDDPETQARKEWENRKAAYAALIERLDSLAGHPEKEAERDLGRVVMTGCGPCGQLLFNSNPAVVIALNPLSQSVAWVTPCDGKTEVFNLCSDDLERISDYPSFICPEC